MSHDAPLVVLAAPGAGGAELAAALADASGRPVAAWDEVSDEPIGEGVVVRTLGREVLWRRERDWTCPPTALEVDDVDRALAVPLQRLLEQPDAPVLHDVTLPFLLPLLLDLCPELQVVIAVRDARESLPYLLSGHDMDPGAADELLRVVNERLVGVATVDGVAVVGVTGDLDLSAVAAELLGTGGGRSRRLRESSPEPGVEIDPATTSLWEMADAGTPQVVTAAALRAAPVGARVELDRHRGPRTVARRALVHAAGERSGPRGDVLECSRALGMAAEPVDPEHATVAYVDGIASLRRALTVPPGSVARLLLPDVLAWCDQDEVETALRLAMEVTRYAGTIIVAHSQAEDDARRSVGLKPLDLDQVTRTATGLGLVPLPAQVLAGVRVLPFAAHTAVAGTVRDLEEKIARLERHLDRRTEQRDAAIAKYDALRERRAVRGVLQVTDALGDTARRLRGDGDG